MIKSHYFNFAPSSYRAEFDEGLQSSLENYLIRGFAPGGFMYALLANDIFSAAPSCHPGNKNSITDIIEWIRWNAPMESYGSYEKVKNWLHDTDHVRTAYVTELEKKFMWKTLQEE